MKRKFLSIFMMLFSAVLFLSCTNVLDAEKKSSKSSGITLCLPYAKSNKAGVFRAGSDEDKIPLKFKVLFVHETGKETSFDGKSGENIVFADAQTGLYKISVQGFNEDNILVYEGSSEAEVFAGRTTTVEIKLKRVIEINLLGWTDEQANMLKRYAETHNDYDIRINYMVIPTINGEYTDYLNRSLAGEVQDFEPDIYAADSAFVLRYTKGDMSAYALPYKEFIPDLEEKIETAELAQYTVDIGTKTDGALVGLAYQTTGGAFIYRRSLAQAVFGTDDPDRVSASIGGGTGSWDKFWEAAQLCKNQRISIVSGDGDLWHPVEGSAEAGWVENGKLHIDSKREAFLDYSKNLYEKGWSNKTSEWTDAWYADMRGQGENPVLGFFGPAWLINYAIEPQCNKDSEGNVIADNRDWAICEAPVGFFWGGTWMLANRKLTQDTSEEGKKKLEAVQKIIEWMTLDTSEEGLQYQWANGLINNAKDTVASKTVMDKSDGTLALLNGQNMFECYNTANEKANVKLLTEYDEPITALWRFEVNKYAEGLITREQALNNFKYSVYAKLGLEPEDSDSIPNYYETQHVRAEPAPDGKGIMFTLTAMEGENWKEGSSFLWENNVHYGIRINNVPTPGNPVTCYYPLTENNKSYAFDCELAIEEGKTVTESVIVQAHGGNEYLTVQDKNFDITLTGKTMKLSKDFSCTIDKSENVKPYFHCDVMTTNKNTDKERWEVDWKQWLNSKHLDYSDTVINRLQNEGEQVLNLNSDTLRKLQEDQYYFVNLTLEFTIEDYPESFRTWIGAYSDVVEYKADELANNVSEHVRAEPDEKGIKITISAKDDEEWQYEWCQIHEANSDFYIQLKGEQIPKPGNPLVCYWPFTKAGEAYFFDCELKISQGEINTIHESVSSTATVNYASLTVNADSIKGFEPQVNPQTSKVTLSKDIRSAITCSGNVTAKYDFGVFTNETSNEGEYKYTQWINSLKPAISESSLYDSGEGLSLFKNDKDTADKLKKDKYFFLDLNLEFFVEGISDCFRYKDAYKSPIYDSSTVLEKFNTNEHISVEPSDDGIKITLRRLETDEDWLDGKVNNIICLTDDGQEGVAINLVYPQDFWDRQIPDTHLANRSPTLDEPEVTYIYPFTEKGKVYEFLLAGPLDKENNWQSEYVRCAAGGGLGELIDVDAWNKNINIKDSDYKNHSFRISGDVSALFDNSKEQFSCANMWIDIRPGTQENHREKTLTYSSMETCVIGNHHDHDWYRTVDDLKNPIVIQNHPDYGTATIAPDASYNEDVFEVLREWDNEFWVVMSIQEVRLAAYPNMTFHLHWK